MTDHRFAVTFFPDVTGRQLTDEEVSLDELRTLVLDTTAPQKAALPLLKLAKFGTKRTAQNSLRHNANVESRHRHRGGITMVRKFSSTRPSPSSKQSRLTALLYTPARGTRQQCRGGASYCRRRKDLPPQEMRDDLTARVNGVFGGIFDGASFTLSQSYYYGYINGNGDHRAEIVEGDFIDLRDDLDATARGKTQSTFDDAAQPRREDARTNKQADPDLVYAAMAVIANDEDGELERVERTGHGKLASPPTSSRARL